MRAMWAAAPPRALRHLAAAPPARGGASPAPARPSLPLCSLPSAPGSRTPRGPGEPCGRLGGAGMSCALPPAAAAGASALSRGAAAEGGQQVGTGRRRGGRAHGAESRRAAPRRGCPLPLGIGPSFPGRRPPCWLFPEGTRAMRGKRRGTAGQRLFPSRGQPGR